MSVTANDIRAAATTLEGQVIRTPMLAAPLLSRQFGCDLYLKLEEQGDLTLLDDYLYNYRLHKGGISLNNNIDKAMAWNIKVRIDTCERRNISIEEVIPKIIQDSKSIHDFYQNSIFLFINFLINFF